MNTLKALLIMSIWTLLIASALYAVGAHENYQDLVWAIGIGITLLLTHMVNMVLYFRVAGDKPYKWFNSEVL
ncbi:MAG: hypothetical protein P8Q37_10080 [Porticoccaceae bacterium]|nr:hypothetical protein [Porticoccaceae bacterium]MDG1475243.1 hypothetical protein [Porticoccaceae bacterium]